MEAYDEDLLLNTFYKVFISKGKPLYQNAAENRWTICIPRKGTTSRSHHNKECFQTHILKPLNKKNNTYCTGNNKEVRIDGSFIITIKGFQDIKSVKILFEETFFNQNEESYHVLCIDHPLEGTYRSSNPDPIIPNLETLQNCIDFLWSGSSNKRTRNQLNEFIRLFNSTYKRIASESIRHTMDAANTLFTRAMQACLKVNHLRRPAMANKAFMDNLKIAVETYVMDGVYKRVFKGISSSYADDDAVFNKTTRNLNDLQLEDLQINTHICKNMSKCKKILSNLNKFTTPLEKLYVLKLTIIAMSESSKAKAGEVYAVTSDDILPGLVFLVVKSEIPNWLANMSYMQNFHFSKSKNDEFQFYLSSVEAAIEHVRNGCLDSMISMTHTQRIKMVDILLQGLDSNEKYIGPSPVDALFEKIQSLNVEEVVKLLNESAINMKQITELLCHPLCSCDKCEKLLASKRNDQSTVTVFSRDEVGCTALHQAAECGCEEIIFELIKKGAVVNATNYHGTTPLHYACQRGHLKATIILTHYGADINACDNSGNTPLHLAVANGHEICVEFLGSNECEVQSQRNLLLDLMNEHGDTALHIACRWGFGKIVFLLLKLGALVDIKNKNGNTPSQCALNEKIQEIFSQEVMVFKEDLESASSLASVLPNGSAKIKACCELADSPTTTKRKKEFSRLMKAIADGDTELVRQKLGISKECDMVPEEIPNPDDIDELLCHPLCQCENCALLQRKVVSEAVTINANSCNNEGVRPLHVASIHGYEKIVTMLLKESAAEPNVKTKDNQRTPLHLACQYNNIECVSLLIKYGARINLKDCNGNTALHFCCTNGHIGPAILLLQAGANVHSANYRGNTPLHDAARWDYPDLVRLLIYYKAPIAAMNKVHLTPLQYSRGDDVQVLLERAIVEEDDDDVKKEVEITNKSKSIVFSEDHNIENLFASHRSSQNENSELAKCFPSDQGRNSFHDDSLTTQVENTNIDHQNCVMADCSVSTDNDTDNMKDLSESACDQPNVHQLSSVPKSNMNFVKEYCEKCGDKLFDNHMCLSSYIETNSSCVKDHHDTVRKLNESNECSDMESQTNYKTSHSLKNKFQLDENVQKRECDKIRRTTVAEIFAAFEEENLHRLRLIADGINKFDRKKSLKKVSTLDKSSPSFTGISNYQLSEYTLNQTSSTDTNKSEYGDFSEIVSEEFSRSERSCHLEENSPEKYVDIRSYLEGIDSSLSKMDSVEEVFLPDDGNAYNDSSQTSHETDNNLHTSNKLTRFSNESNDKELFDSTLHTNLENNTEGICNIAIAEVDNGDTLSLSQNEKFASRISELINEAIEDSENRTCNISDPTDVQLP